MSHDPESRLRHFAVLAAVVIPVFAAAIALTWLAYRTGSQTASDLASQSIQQIHARIENHLDHLMDLAPAINRLNRARLRESRCAVVGCAPEE